MRLRKRYLPLLFAAIAGAIAVIPGLADGGVPPSSASFTASDFQWRLTDGSGTEATIAPGGTVTFSYPAGSSTHNADFGSGVQPTSCTQTAGGSSGSVPPLPHTPTEPGWSGSCTFDTEGTYTFHCDHHPSMIGVIHVQATTTTSTTTTTTSTTLHTTSTTTTTGSSTTAGGTTTTTTTTSGALSTGAGAGTGTITYLPGSEPSGSGSGSSSGRDSLRGTSLKVSATQHGARVRGSVQIARPHSRLEIDVLVPKGSLAHTSAAASTSAGRLVKQLSAAGRVSFTVPLNAVARRALNRRKHLTLTVIISLTPPHASKLTRTVRVTMRP
jgi:hypothetical protein